MGPESASVNEINTGQPESKILQEAKTGVDFQVRFDATLCTPLSPENIDSYADNAVQGLIKLTGAVLEAYNSKSKEDLSGKELEDAALKYYGLPDIAETLDDISGKAQEIKKIDAMMARVVATNSVLVPPVSGRGPVVEGAGNFEKSLTIARTKTLLFILGNDFNIDINNPDQLVLTTGILTGEMMRRLSYTMIEVPQLKRIILCCDEEGNVTYVFNSAHLKERGTTGVDMANLNKAELDKLLKSEPSLGRRIVYTNRFVSNMIGLIKEIGLEEGVSSVADSDKFLYPKAPGDIQSANAIAMELGVDIKTVTKAISDLGELLVGVKKYRFSGQVTAGYAPGQREIITQHLQERGHFTEKAPADILSINGLADSLGVSYNVVLKAIDGLGGLIGEPRRYKFGNRIAAGYSPAQRQLISNRLEKQGLLSLKAPEGVLSIFAIAKDLRLDSGVVTRAIEELEAELGETKKYKFSGNPSTGYTPEQQNMIRERLKRGGYLSEKAPEGVLSNDGIARMLGVGDRATFTAIEALGDDLGQIRNYKFGSRVTAGYTPEQQAQIIAWLSEQGLNFEKVPSGILSRRGISVALGLHERTVQSAIEELGGNIGETKKYKFGPKTATGYTLEQQKMIKDYLESHSVLSEKAPAMILSANGIASLYGLDRETVTSAIAELGDSLGDTKEYKFYSRATAGYTPEQQNMIRDRLKTRGNLLPKKPEDFVSRSGLASRFGKGDPTITRAILELGEKLGEVKAYGSGSKPGVAYSPAQQEMVRQYLEENGFLEERAPAGFLPVARMRRVFGRDTKAILRAIDDLRGELGVIRKYTFGSKVTTGYSPDQQAMIKRYLDNR